MTSTDRERKFAEWLFEKIKQLDDEAFAVNSGGDFTHVIIDGTFNLMELASSILDECG